MKNRIGWTLIVIAAAALSLLPGCFKLTREYKESYYYQMEYDPPPVEGEAFSNVVLRISGIDVAPSYQSQKIIYATQSLRRKSYDYHLWTVNPGDMLTDLLLRDLVASGKYKAVVDIRSSLIPHYEIEGIIERIYERDSGDSYESVLALNCLFFAFDHGKHVLFQRVYTETVPAAGKEPADVVAAMSEAARRISLRVQADVNAAVGQYEQGKK